MDEETFQIFEAFDFDSNESFQTGWAAIAKLIDPEKQKAEHLRAKAFFFSRNVCQFDFDSYLLWRRRKGSEGIDNIHCATKEDNKTARTPSSSAELPLSTEHPAQHVQQSPLSHSNESEIDNDRTIEQGLKTLSLTSKPKSSEIEEAVGINTSGNADKSKDIDSKMCSSSEKTEGQAENQLSLAELAHMIQNKLPIPGVITVDVKPTNSDPTPSAMNRRSKPWEVDKGDNAIPSISELVSNDDSENVS